MRVFCHKYKMPATSAIHLYRVPQVANLFVAGIHPGVHMITASTYGRSLFRIFRRVENDLDFLIRDVDRQPVTITGTLSLLINDDQGNTLLTVPLTVVNAPRAQYRAAISASDSLKLSSGVYSWTVKNIDAGSITRILYTNQDYAVHGIVEVSEGLVVPLDEPIVITNYTPDMGAYYSSTLLGSLKTNNLTGNHSALGYFQNFTGTIYIDASLDTAIPASNSDWQQVERFDFVDQNATYLMNIYGNFNYLRIRPSTIVGLNKIVYRS